MREFKFELVSALLLLCHCGMAVAEDDRPSPDPPTSFKIAHGTHDDAKNYVDAAAAGYDTRAFDIADTAVAWCKKRFPESAVDYRQGDLLQLPEDWRAELVYECFTVQALPLAMRREVMEAVARLVAPGGRLFVVTLLRPSDDPPEGPPWPLSRREVDDFLALGLEEVSRVEEMGETVVTAAITYARRA